MSKSNYTVVLSTCENEEQAKVIINALLEKKLVACVQLQNITSYYTWKGAVENGSEVLMLIKTSMEHYDEVEECIKSNHPYETPEIICVPVTKGFTAYLSWIDEVTK